MHPTGLAPLAADERFQAFGAEHYALLVGAALGAVIAVWLGRRLRGVAERPVCRAYAVVLLAVTVPLQVLQLLPRDFDAGTSLPFQLCDLSWMVAAYALWTRSERATGVLYYWGLTLVLQAILTPSLGQSFPDPRFFMYWGMHLLTFWAAFFLSFGLGYRPTWRGYRFTLGCTALWALAALAFNQVAGTNFGYLDHKPSGGSLLDLLGPWPVYLVVEVVLVAAVWALLTWPFTRVRREATIGRRRQARDPV